FRPPYAADSSPTQLSELTPLKIAEDLNYLIVLESIDPQDWSKPGADVILQRVKQQRRDGNIILLHDAGGDRSQTVEALPRILDWLQERGDKVVPLSELLNISRDDLMPPVLPGSQSGWRTVAMSGFRAWHWVVEFLWTFMIVATALVVLRTLLIAWLAWRHRAAQKPSAATGTEPVSVLIAAYNE